MMTADQRNTLVDWLNNEKELLFQVGGSPNEKYQAWARVYQRCLAHGLPFTQKPGRDWQYLRTIVWQHMQKMAKRKLVNIEESQGECERRIQLPYADKVVPQYHGDQ